MIMGATTTPYPMHTAHWLGLDCGRERQKKSWRSGDSGNCTYGIRVAGCTRRGRLGRVTVQQEPQSFARPTSCVAPARVGPGQSKRPDLSQSGNQVNTAAGEQAQPRSELT